MLKCRQKTLAWVDLVVPWNETTFVYATDTETGGSGYKRVVQIFERETDELVEVTVNDETITTTPTHPFYVPQKGWTEAIELRAGDILVTCNGEYVVVEKVQHELLETPVTVYNFEVEDFHTYYVAADADSDEFVLVHNKCGYKPLRQNDYKAVINPGEMEAPHAHIFKKANNIGRVFRDGTLDNSLATNRGAMSFLKRNLESIMEMIDTFYGKR